MALGGSTFFSGGGGGGTLYAELRLGWNGNLVAARRDHTARADTERAVACKCVMRGVHMIFVTAHASVDAVGIVT